MKELVNHPPGSIAKKLAHHSQIERRVGKTVESIAEKYVLWKARSTQTNEPLQKFLNHAFAELAAYEQQYGWTPAATNLRVHFNEETEHLLYPHKSPSHARLSALQHEVKRLHILLREPYPKPALLPALSMLTTEAHMLELEQQNL